jgi:hypothetical protein
MTAPSFTTNKAYGGPEWHQINNDRANQGDHAHPKGCEDRDAMTLYHAQLPTSFNHSDDKGNEWTIARMSRFSKTLLSRLGVSWTAIFTMARAKSSARMTWFGNNNRNAG